MAELTSRYREAGYRQFQLKVGGEVDEDILHEQAQGILFAALGVLASCHGVSHQQRNVRSG